MRVMNMKKAISKTQLLLAGMLMAALWFVPAASAAVPGITGPNFQPERRARNTSTQPDGSSVYSWGYGCSVRAGRVSRLRRSRALSAAICRCPVRP